jgi:hypothetical protein
VSKRAALVGGLLVFAAALVYFSSYAQYGLAYDEGYLLDGVERLMDGQLIYRDFHHTYAPGRFYLIALAFQAFGRNLLVERYVFAFLEAVKCLLAFLIVRELTRSWWSLLAPFLIMIAPGPWHKVFFSSVGFVATYAVVLSIRRRPGFLVVAGLVVGCCAFFRQDVAGFAFLGGLAGIAIHGLTEHRGVRDLFLRVVLLAAGILIIAAPVLLYFHLHEALKPMIHQITVDGMRDNMTNRIPYPGLGAVTRVDSSYLLYVLPVKLLFYLPFAVYALTLLVILRRVLSRKWTPAATSLVVVALVSILAFNQSVWRSDLGHLLQSMQYVFLLIPVVLASGIQRFSGRPHWGLKVPATIFSALAPPAFLIWASFGIVKASLDPRVIPVFAKEGLSVGDVEYLGSIAVRAGNDTKLGLKRAPVYVRPEEARFFGALGTWLDANTAHGDYVLAVPQLQMLYFFYDRKNPTRYAHYRRAIEPEEEERYIRDIATHRTEYILLTEPFEGAKMGETRESFADYAPRVRAWILANYTEVGRLGSVRILERNP